MSARQRALHHAAEAVARVLLAKDGPAPDLDVVRCRCVEAVWLVVAVSGRVA